MNFSMADLPTPCLVVDGASVRKNIESMQAYCQQHQLSLSPHTKTHKSKWVGSLQVAAGAKALTVAKAGEAEVMSEVANEIFVAYPPVGSQRMQRVAKLAGSRIVRIGVDSLEASELASSEAKRAGVSLGVLVDLDVGFQRTGVRDCRDALDLALQITKLPNLQLRGMMCFPGNVGSAADDPQWQVYIDKLGEFLDSWQRHGLPTPIVSGGSTPTAMHSHLNKYLTEIRPGTYVYNDINELRLGVATLEQCAARVACTVVSRPTGSKCIVDAGSKMLSSDRCSPLPESGFGMVVEFPVARISRLSEEHGEIEFPEGQLAPVVGTRLTIIPNHICVCVNLQNSFLWYENGALTEYRVDARGMVN